MRRCAVPSKGADAALSPLKKPAAAGKSIGIDDCHDRYRIDAVIGEGGTGRVVKAFDKILEMDVAIKILSPKLTADKDALKSLKNEVRITLGLNHHHILRIYNLEKSGDRYLVVMEYLKGRTVADYLRDNPDGFAPRFAASLLEVVSSALSYAHGHGILHRDLTPGNLFLTDDGVVKLIDFGIAAAAGKDSKATGDVIVGTPEYMSPEQIRGEELRPSSDIYSLGVLAMQFLTGKTLFPHGTKIEDMAFRPHPPVSGLAEALAAVIEKATSFNPDSRHQSATDFARELAMAAGTA